MNSDADLLGDNTPSQTNNTYTDNSGQKNGDNLLDMEDNNTKK